MNSSRFLTDRKQQRQQHYSKRLSPAAAATMSFDSGREKKVLEFVQFPFFFLDFSRGHGAAIGSDLEEDRLLYDIAARRLPDCGLPKLLPCGLGRCRWKRGFIHMLDSDFFFRGFSVNSVWKVHSACSIGFHYSFVWGWNRNFRGFKLFAAASGKKIRLWRAVTEIKSGFFTIVSVGKKFLEIRKIKKNIPNDIVQRITQNGNN